MTQLQQSVIESQPGKLSDYLGHTRRNRFSIRLFSGLIGFILVLAVMATGYWLVFASDRYVSEGYVFVNS